MTSNAVGAPRRILPSLSALRVPALVVVVGFHAVDNAIGPRVWHVPGVDRLLPNAEWALTAFFVLSGFVLTLGWTPAQTARGFYVRRFARIYPMYVAAWATAVAVTYVVTHRLPSLGVAAATLLLGQTLVPSLHFVFGVDLVFWSLSNEVVFYLALPWLLPRLERLSTRRLQAGIVACFGWLVVLPVPVWALAGGHGIRVLTEMPWYRCGEFLTGVLLCLLLRRGWRPRLGWRPATAAAAGWVLAASGAVDVAIRHGGEKDDVRLVGMLACYPLLVWLVAALAAADMADGAGWWSNRRFARAGDWTYVMYLFHVPLLVPFNRLAAHTSAPSDLALLAAYCVVLCTASAAIHERALVPVERAIKRRWSPGAERPAYPHAGVPAQAPGASSPEHRLTTGR